MITQACMTGGPLVADNDTGYAFKGHIKEQRVLVESIGACIACTQCQSSYGITLCVFLLQGTNAVAIKTIISENENRYLTWKQACNCLMDKQLPDDLRARYCSLFIGTLDT